MAKKKGRQNQAKGFRRVNPNAAGIDIGSKTHYVAVAPERGDTSVRTFECFTPDLHKMAKWLKDCAVATVAMESTGSFWIPVAHVLEKYNLEVVLVDARSLKNVPGRKTDVLDCQWLQQLHSFGLLKAAFRPEKEIAVLRSYWRHRQELTKSCSQQIQLMQKALEEMNLQLHKVLSDITGETGMKIIRALAGGEKDPKILAKLASRRIKSSRETLIKALSGNCQPQHLFVLKQAVDLYDFYQQKIADCDREIESYMESLPDKTKAAPPGQKPSKRRKNQPFFDLRTSLYKMAGVDLTTIDGINTLTAQAIISECGYDMSKFPTEKAFCSWLGLCPNPQITGGKTRRTRTKRTHNRASTALRLAAQSLHKSTSALGAYYRRMRARLGAPKAITATAHKLARIVYRMLKHGEEYVRLDQDHYERQYKERAINNLVRNAKRLGYQISPSPIP